MLTRVVAAASAVCLLVLSTGCDKDDTTAADPTSTAPTTVATVAPNGLTVPGTVVALGKPATVVWTVDKKHASRIELRVTGARHGRISDLDQFKLNDQVKQSSVFYVDAKVTNVGGGNVSGAFLPLFGKVSDQLVIPPVHFGSTFKRCEDRPMPDKFGKGATASVCVVMLAQNHGKVSAIEWRGPNNVAPISWSLR